MGRAEAFRQYQKESFVGGLKDVYRTVLEPCGVEHLEFGPTYHVLTSKGDPLRIHTAHSTIPLMHPLVGDMVETVWVFLAQNEQGNILGYRHTALKSSKDQDGWFWEACGDIGTSEPGGIAMPIELAHFDVLHRVAVLTGEAVQYVIENANSRTVRLLENQVALKPDDHDLITMLLAKRLEQERWQVLYGPNGRLGFDDRGAKVFIHRGVADMMFEIPIETIDTIKIDRTDEHLYGLDGVYAFPTANEDVAFLQDQKRGYCKAQLLPQIQRLVTF